MKFLGFIGGTPLRIRIRRRMDVKAGVDRGAVALDGTKIINSWKKKLH
jgi:hypothetical protein